MDLAVNQPVVSVDGKPLGHVAAIELDAEGTETGLVVRRTDGYGGETRLPIAWVAGVASGVVSLTVTRADVSTPRSQIGFRPAPMFVFDPARVAEPAREQANPQRIHPNWLRPRSERSRDTGEE